MKKLIHNKCGQVVNRRTLVCPKCAKRPPALELVLIKDRLR